MSLLKGEEPRYYVVRGHSGSAGACPPRAHYEDSRCINGTSPWRHAPYLFLHHWSSSTVRRRSFSSTKTPGKTCHQLAIAIFLSEPQSGFFLFSRSHVTSAGSCPAVRCACDGCTCHVCLFQAFSKQPPSTLGAWLGLHPSLFSAYHNTVVSEAGSKGCRAAPRAKARWRTPPSRRSSRRSRRFMARRGRDW